MSTIELHTLEKGQELPELVNDAITRVQLVKYAGASGDFNPLHTDDEFAQNAGLDGVIAHGMLSMGFLGKYVRHLSEDKADIEQINVRFSSMARPGDVLTCSGKVSEIEVTDSGRRITFKIQAVNQKGDIVTKGSSRIRLF